MGEATNAAKVLLSALERARPHLDAVDAAQTRQVETESALRALQTQHDEFKQLVGERERALQKLDDAIVEREKQLQGLGDSITAMQAQHNQLLAGLNDLLERVKI